MRTGSQCEIRAFYAVVDGAILDTGRLAGELAHVEDASATHGTLAHDLDRGDARRMHREDAFDGNLAAELANGEHRGDAAAANLDDNALEGLNTFLVTFDDLVIDLDRVARAELWEVRTEVLELDGLKGGRHCLVSKS